MTGDLAVWLRAQLDAQERWLRKPLKDFMDQCQECGFAQQADGSPYSHAWLLADITAKKKLLAMYAAHDHSADADHRWSGFAGGYATATDQMIEALAQPYAGRPGWHNEWNVS